MTNTKPLTFIWKRQTVSGKLGGNMVTWSLLPFAVNAILNLPIILFESLNVLERTMYSQQRDVQTVVASSFTDYFLITATYMQSGLILR